MEFSFFFLRISYINIKEVAPAKCEIPNPVPLGAEIIKLDKAPLGKLEEIRGKNFFVDCKKVVVVFYDDKVTFWKYGSEPGKLKQYTFDYDPYVNGELVYRTIKNVDIESDVIKIELKWDIDEFFNAAIMSIIIIGLIILFCFLFVKALRWTFKKPKTEIS